MSTLTIGGTTYNDLMYQRDILFSAGRILSQNAGDLPVISGYSYTDYEYLIVTYATTVSSNTYYCTEIINTTSGDYHLAMVISGIPYTRRITSISASNVYVQNGYKGAHRSSNRTSSNTACMVMLIEGLK